MKETSEELAIRVDNIGRRLATMPFGKEGSRERKERDRLSDIGLELQGRLFQMRRKEEEDELE